MAAIAAVATKSDSHTSYCCYHFHAITTLFFHGPDPLGFY